MKTRPIIPIFLFVLSFSLASAADLSIVQRWLDTNANTKSLKVDFIQSRALKTVKNPLVQEGTLWMNYPTNQFRWQLGAPAKTIVVSQQDDQIAVLRTPLKRVEFRQAGQSSSAPGLSSLTKGFPKTMAEFEKRYRVLSTAKKGNAYEIVTQPIGPDSEGVSRFRFVLDPQRFLLKGMVIDLKDGSMVTTTFQRVNRNEPIQAQVFRPDLTGYKQTKFRQG